jgi:hypothetical protein
MEKQIVPLNNSDTDLILCTYFNKSYKDGKPEYIDEEKRLFKGNNLVNSIYIVSPVYGENGITSYSKFYLTKGDIIKIYDKIKEIESVEIISKEETPDLPF